MTLKTHFKNRNRVVYNSPLADLLAELAPQKRKVFISYHHADQAWVDLFRSHFGSTYDVFTDCSLDQAIQSNNLLYINRTIREDYITGTSITIVICGTETWKRKCVDWEIISTLNKDHALLGIALPTNRTFENGHEQRTVPDRLYKNIVSGYADSIDWTLSAQELAQAIDISIRLSKQSKALKDNSAPKMLRNL